MKCINMLARANRGSIAGARRASTAAGGWNWLEEDCGDVPDPAKALDMETSQMLRGGHAVQVANANLLNGQVRMLVAALLERKDDLSIMTSALVITACWRDARRPDGVH